MDEDQVMQDAPLEDQSGENTVSQKQTEKSPPKNFADFAKNLPEQVLLASMRTRHEKPTGEWAELDHKLNGMTDAVQKFAEALALLKDNEGSADGKNKYIDEMNRQLHLNNENSNQARSFLASKRGRAFQDKDYSPDQGSFGILPREVSEQIFREVLVKPHNGLVECYSWRRQDDGEKLDEDLFSHPACQVSSGVFRVSRRFYNEATYVFYSENTFVFGRQRRFLRPNGQPAKNMLLKLDMRMITRCYLSTRPNTVLLKKGGKVAANFDHQSYFILSFVEALRDFHSLRFLVVDCYSKYNTVNHRRPLVERHEPWDLFRGLLSLHGVGQAHIEASPRRFNKMIMTIERWVTADTPCPERSGRDDLFSPVSWRGRVGAEDHARHLAQSTAIHRELGMTRAQPRYP